MQKIFIDGEAGTTGLLIRERLTELPVEVLGIEETRRKDPEARAQRMAEADLVVLCLPDQAAAESVALAEALGERAPKILDASTAHRVSPDFIYGFAEISATQPAAIKAAQKVANPGCYATGAIGLLRPLVDEGLVASGAPITVNAVSGYSGGGRAMIAAHEAAGGPAFQLYGLDLAHKHIPEIMHHAGLARPPLFVPSVGHFPRGMLVSIPLFVEHERDIAAFHATLDNRYAGSARVRVMAAGATTLEAETKGGSDIMELYVFGNAHNSQALLVAKLDNLGKGAAGAAVDNIRLMLGLADG